ncbi:hypothetical protein ACKXGF_07425 [Alkalibacillus sp. S2W]|uniref:hypothetical protein n=1 Tax=Alkalibacillus sp. S2W TaxID=3386553 RepID=UPI00398CE559
MYLLSLDQSTTNTGLAQWKINGDEAELIQFGKYNLKKGKGKEHYPYTFQPLVDKINQFDYNEVVLEEVYAGGNKQTFKQLVRLQYQIIMECYMKDIDFKVVYPTSWQATMRKLFNIKEWISKKSSVQIVRDLLHIPDDEKISDDMAESILIGIHYLIKEKGIEFKNISFNKAERI